jgi:hypothetical protein
MSNNLFLSDTSIRRFSLLYIALPFFLFFGTWFRWELAISLNCIFSVSLILVYRTKITESSVPAQLAQKKLLLVLVLLILAVWVYFSGIGSFSFQHDDHQFRNAIFWDLSQKNWPITYKIDGFKADHPLQGQSTVLIYYFAFWLPAALVSKIFGLAVGTVFLYFWALLGLYLVVYQLFVFYNKVSFKVLFLFLAWGSFYFLGSIYEHGLKSVVKGEAYLWINDLLYADGNIGLVYWTFNQTIVPWLIILLFINYFQPKNAFFIYACLFFYGPFSFMGFFPFVVFFSVKNILESNVNSPWQKIKPFLSFQNTIGAMCVVGFLYLYYKSNVMGNFFMIKVRPWSVYFTFIVVSIGAILALITQFHRKNALFYLVVFVLFLLPFGQMGWGLDFPSRVSIPAMFLLMLLFGQVWFQAKATLKYLLLCYLLFSFTGHHIQFFRSVYYTGLHYAAYEPFNNWLPESDFKHRVLLVKDQTPFLQDHIKTLSAPNNYLISNFMGTQDSFYYQYLAPHK